MPVLSEPEYKKLLNMLNIGWHIVDGFHLEKEFKFGNFRQAFDFAIMVGELAESEGHHPDIYLSWGKTKISTWTHVIGGLSENDFILAAKIDLIDQ